MSAQAAESISPTAASISAAATGSASEPSRSPTGAAAQRSGRPLSLHAGPNQPAAGSDAAAAVGPHPAAPLHRHALECVFACLSQEKLAFALRVARGWLAAAQSMRRLELQIWREPSAAPGVVARSTMGRHVGCLNVGHLNAALLAVLADRMGHLRALRCTLQGAPSQPLAFPASLRQLKVELMNLDGAVDVSAAIAAVSQLQLLDDLSVQLFALDPRISFAPLAALLRLRHLEIRALSGPGEFSDAQVDELRALPQPLRVDLNLTTRLLRRLLRPPHGLQWQYISLPIPLDDECAAQLARLPSLTMVHGQAACSRFDWLRGLPNLTDVSLTFSDVDPQGRAAAMAAGLQGGARLEFLSLFNHVTVAHLAELLPRLPRLRELTFSGLNIDSLAFLAQPPMTEQLISLGLWHCRRLPLAELRHVHSLRGLKKLQLYHSFTARMDEHSRSLFEPPSAALPQLQLFDCIGC